MAWLGPGGYVRGKVWFYLQPFRRAHAAGALATIRADEIWYLCACACGHALPGSLRRSMICSLASVPQVPSSIKRAGGSAVHNEGARGPLDPVLAHGSTASAQSAPRSNAPVQQITPVPIELTA